MKEDPASLDRLRDIVDPAPVAWWPPPDTFWILVALALAWMAVALAVLERRHRARAYRRAAHRRLDELTAIGNIPASAINLLLKQTALAAYPREKVAPLTGSDWLAFLDHTGHTTAFTKGPGVVLAETYHDAPLTTPPLTTAARRWISHHRTRIRPRKRRPSC